MNTMKVARSCLIAVFVLFAGVDLRAAELLGSSESRLIQEGFERMKMQTADPCAEAPESNRTRVDAKPSCSRLGDDICLKLNNAVSGGNLEFENSRFYTGVSEKSYLTMAYKMNLQALIESRTRLPRDLRPKAEPILRKMEAYLSTEFGSMGWLRNLQEIEDEFFRALRKTAEARVSLAGPEKRQNIKNVITDLKNEVLEAKYSNHPNWKRVEKVYHQVKEDLLAEISEMSISEELREQLRARVRAVELSLPYPDPRKIYPWPNCSEDSDNAFYDPSFHKLSVCAGLFNSFQDESALAYVIAHELGHAIDISRQAEMRLARSDVGKALSRFCNAKGPAMSCAEWKGIRGKLIARPRSISISPAPFDKLGACLKPLKGLRRWDSKKLREAADQMAADVMENASYLDASENSAFQSNFEALATVSSNEFYMGPAVLRGRSFATAGTNGCRFDMTYEVLTQILFCSGYGGLAPSARGPAFQKALQETEQIHRVLFDHWFRECGRNCPELVQDSLSRDVEEQLSDWYAHRVMVRYLKREESLLSRRDIASRALARFCASESSLNSDSPYSTDVQRRRSFFDREISDLVGCERDESPNPSSDCRL